MSCSDDDWLILLSFATERKQNVTERKLQIQAAKVRDASGCCRFRFTLPTSHAVVFCSQKSLEQAVLRAVNVRKGGSLVFSNFHFLLYVMCDYTF